MKRRISPKLIEAAKRDLAHNVIFHAKLMSSKTGLSENFCLDMVRRRLKVATENIKPLDCVAGEQCKADVA